MGILLWAIVDLIRPATRGRREDEPAHYLFASLIATALCFFNATEVETGKRLLISNAKLPEDRDMPAEGSETRRPYEYFQLGKKIDLNVATAARLSATFPYVSPICRANDEDEPGRGTGERGETGLARLRHGLRKEQGHVRPGCQAEYDRRERIGGKDGLGRQ